MTMLKSIRRLIPAIFIFSAILACVFSPYRVAATESIEPASASGEKIATFDEDEKATFEQETTAVASPFLHGNNYQPPVYFPDRQKRTLTTYPWMRIIPFAALVILALATTRFLGRRRQAGTRAGSEKLTIIETGVSHAMACSPVEDTELFLEEGREKGHGND
jgi:hypothetical protein